MKRFTVLLLLLSLILGLSACTTEPRVPIDGIWFCTELQAQFSTDQTTGFFPENYTHVVDESQNYVVVSGDRIAALLTNDHGSMEVCIICQETDNPNYELGENIFTLEFVSLSDTEYVLKDKEGKKYTFIRMDKVSTDG